MGKVGAVQYMGCMHPICRESSGRVLDQGYVVTELHCIAAGSFDAGVGQQSDHNHLAYPMLLKMEVETGVRKAVLGPMFLDDDIARLRHKIGMPFAAPAVFRKNLLLPEASWSGFG